MAAWSSRVLSDCHVGDGGACESADDDIHGRPSSTQAALSDPPPGAAPVYCPECSLLLVGKVAALIPCGHVHHSHCAEYLTRMARSRGGLCGHCKLRVSGSRVLHLSVDETAGGGDGDDDAAAVSGERLEQIKAEVAEVAALQRVLVDEDRRAREEKRREKDLQHQCAALYQQNDVLRRAVASAFGDGSTSKAAVGASVSAIVAATAATADTTGGGGGGGAARDPTGFAHDPLTSIVQLQQHVMDCADAERALAGRLAQVNGDFTKLGALIEGYRDERQRLAAEKAVLRRRVRRRRPMLELAQEQPARRQPVPSPVKIEPGSAAQGGALSRGTPLLPHHVLNRQTAVGGRGETDPRSSGAAVVMVLSSDDDGSSDAGQMQQQPQQRAAESDAGSDSDVILVDEVGASSASAGGLPSGPVRPSATTGASLAPGGLPRPRFGEVPRPRPQQRLL